MKRLLSLCLLFATACSSGGTASIEPAPTAGDPGGDPAPGTNDDVPAHILALEDQTFLLVNLERTAEGIGAMVHDEVLRDVARAHSEDMVQRSFFAHTNPDGLDPFDRMTLAGVTYSSAAENIAWNQGYADPAGTAVDGWMASTGHRTNILNDTYTATGLGIAESSAGAFYFTQVFVRPTGSVLLVGWRSARSVVIETGDQLTSG